MSQNVSNAKKLTFCAISIALSFVLSYVKIIHMPYGGSVTLFSMFFICYAGYVYGLGTGIAVGFTYGILQFIQSPTFVNIWQLCCDYLLAFTCLGLAGGFRDHKYGLIKGYLFGIIMRGVFHSIGGYMFWMEYMPDNFPKSLTAIYPIVYNYSYILIEGLLTIIVMNIPPVKKAIESIAYNARR